MIVERQWLEAGLQSGEGREYLARRMRYDHNEKEIWFWRMFANKEVSPYKSYHVVGSPKTRGTNEKNENTELELERFPFLDKNRRFQG